MLKEEVEKMWEVKVNMLSVGTETLGAVNPNLLQHQKSQSSRSAVPGTAKILFRTLKLLGLWLEKRLVDQFSMVNHLQTTILYFCQCKKCASSKIYN